MTRTSFSGQRVQRFWRFDNESERLDGSGFFVAPNLDEPRNPNRGVRSFPAAPLSLLENVQCLVLLGEPGMGKTTAVEEAMKANAQTVSELLHVNLNAFSEEGTLLRRVFENKKFKAWRKDGCDLHLWLDSLDECLLRIETLGSLLGQELQQQLEEGDPSRLWLRMTCRSAVWPISLERHLHNAFGENSVQLLHLCPLQRSDVETLASAVGVESQPFMNEVERHAATALAARPMTLEFLLNSFKSGSMATTRDELFRQGCLHLCTELNEHRRETRRMGELSPVRRLEIAARLAALSVFSGRPFLWRGPDLHAPSASLTLSDILDQSDGQSSDSDISLSDVNEVLDTALFSARDLDGTFLSSFAHRTYAEFLAAYHLDSQKVPSAQILNLLRHSEPISSSAALVPQLTETAAWMALFDLKAGSEGNGAFRYMVQTHPAGLLRADVAFAPDAEKAQLARALLEEIQAGRLTDRWNRNDYRYLDGSGLAEQLEPFIVDPAKDIIARRAAIDIAEKCPHAFGLADVLAKLALDENEDINARIQAAYAVMKIGQATNDSALLLRLRPLALQQPDADKDDELKGVALTTLWPTHMSAEEFFSLLQPPKSEIYGAYRGLLYHVPERLQPADLPIALHWCSSQDGRIGYNEELWDVRRLIGDIVDLACEHLSETGVTEALAGVLAVRMRHHDLEQIWPSQNTTSEPVELLPCPPDEQRHALVISLVRLLSGDKEKETLRNLFYVRGQHPAWVLPQDLDWLLAQTRGAVEEAQLTTWAFLVERLSSLYGLPCDPELAQKLYETKNIVPILADALSEWFEPVEIDSQRAKSLRESHGFWERHEREQKEHEERQNAKRQEYEAKRLEAIEKYLIECETGAVESWWSFDYYAIRDQGASERHTHLNDKEFWKNADNRLRGRILKVAEAYLREYKPPQELLDQWSSSVFDRRALAAHRALLLLFLENRTAFDALPQHELQMWAKATVWFPWAGGETWEADNHALLRALHKRAPEAVTEAVLARIEHVNGREDHLFDLRKLQFQWDGTLCDALIEKAGDVALRPPLLYDLLKGLLQLESALVMACWLSDPGTIGKFEPGPAWHKAETLLTQSLAAETRNDERAKFIALALLDYAPDGGWPIVWPAMQSDPVWGQKVMLDFAPHDRHLDTGYFLKWMPEDALADWFLWLRREFPCHEDPHVGGFHTISQREQLGYFRDGLPKLLQGRGTPQAVRALERIVRNEAEHAQSDTEHWIKYLLPEARQLALAGTWSPAQPREIAMLLRSPHKRFVSNGDELLDVLVESLQRFDRKLQDETPAAPDLWNSLPSGKSRPKDENALADRLKRHLEDDIGGRAVVVNREVEIRRGDGEGDNKGKGERTDIHVDAIVPSNDGAQEWSTITAIIEVKGAWHAELRKAMEMQLRDRYLKDNSCEHGLYVVGWFECPQWDRTDSRRRKAPKMTLEETRSLFDQQAISLSHDGAHLRALVLDAKLR
jgi:hypothetical protein